MSLAKQRAKKPGRQGKRTASDPSARERAFAAAFGAAIKRARAIVARTQLDLATRAELSPNYLARVERGEVSLSLYVAHRIAEALGTTIDALLANAKSPPPLVRTKLAQRARDTEGRAR